MGESDFNSMLGSSDGLNEEGVQVGASVGTFDFTLMVGDKDEEGTAVGKLVFAAVGLCVSPGLLGKAVGIKVGDTVGTALGTAVGSPIGVRVTSMGI